VQNDLQHAVDVSQNVVIPEAENAVALAFEKSRALRISAGILVMLSAVNLDNESGMMAHEVGDVGPQPNLPPEMSLLSPQAMSKVPPQLLLGVGRCGTHLSRSHTVWHDNGPITQRPGSLALVRTCRSACHSHHPHP
jgi:hypothetical protein